MVTNLLVFLTLFLSISTYAITREPKKRAAQRENAMIKLLVLSCPWSTSTKPAEAGERI